MDVRAVLADVAEFGPFFTVGTDPAVGREPGWRPIAELYTDPEPLRARLAHVRGVLDSDDRVAASITFQGLAALIVSAPLAAAVVHAVVPELTARSLQWRPGGDGPWTLWSGAPTGVAVPDAERAAEALARALFEEHLVPLIAAVRAHAAISERLLWGSVASSVASGALLVGARHPGAAGRARSVAEGLLALGPLAGTGGFRVDPDAPDRPGPFRRRSCCLYYRVPNGGLCGDCVLHERADR